MRLKDRRTWDFSFSQFSRIHFKQSSFFFFQRRFFIAFQGRFFIAFHWGLFIAFQRRLFTTFDWWISVAFEWWISIAFERRWTRRGPFSNPTQWTWRRNQTKNVIWCIHIRVLNDWESNYMSSNFLLFLFTLLSS